MDKLKTQKQKEVIMMDKVKIKIFKNDSPDKVAEEINSFGNVKNVIATQPFSVNNKWIVWCYYK